jgi:beta-glucanase (GH16 family)
MKATFSAFLITAFLVVACQCTPNTLPSDLIVDNGDEGDEMPASPSGQEGSGETDGYKLVWADYFDGTALNTDDWNIEVNGDGGGNKELQYYRAENVTVENGCLVLTARKETYLGKDFTSGRLNTSGKRFFTHGKIESSIRLPKTANGLWPAFWMLGNDFKQVGWPKCGEIDILEMGNSEGIRKGTQETFFNGACHWGFYKDGAYPNYAKSSNAPYSLQDGKFHLYTLIWDKQSIAMYLDLDQNPSVQPYYKMDIVDTNGDWAVGKYFHHDFFIVYDLAIGGNFPGIHSASGITALADGPASMYIDFVKVYQK